jgi:hypothetical protein
MRRIEHVLLMRVLICLVFLGMCWTSGIGQVVIVQSKARLTRPTSTSGKGKKYKAKTGGSPSATAAEETEPETTTNLNATRPEMAFVVIPPKLSAASTAFNFRLSSTALFPASKMVNFVYDVITADNRGKIIERRQESAR